MRTISFSENGDVLNGNIYEKSIMEIIEEYKVQNKDTFLFLRNSKTNLEFMRCGNDKKSKR